jgi:type I restriction enzyme S subunit
MNIPSDWETAFLGDLCSIEIGGTPSRNVAEYWDSAKETNNAWLSIRDLNKRVIHTTSEHISADGVKNSNVKLQSAGTVLMSFKLSIGRVAYAGVPLYTNEAIAGLRSEAVDHDFLYQGLQHCDLLAGVDQAIKGATLNKAKLKKIKFQYPPSRDEQSKIAEILSTVDQAIEQTEALIAKQQRIKTGLMQDLLTRGIDEHGQLRTEQTHAFKDSPLGRIPVEWEVKTIGEVFDVQLGKMLSQKSSNGLAPFFYLGNKNVQWDRVDLSDLQMMDFDEREREKFKLLHNDILMCEGGEVGRTSLWKGELADCYYQKAIHRLRPKNGAYLPELFPRFIQWGIRQGLLGDFTSQTSIAHLTQEKLNTVPIIIPTVPDQEAMVLRLNSHDMALANLLSSALKLKSVKRALMQDLLTGRKRVTDLLEPAAA